MKVLVLNAGSTSVKYNLYDMDTEAPLASGRVERIGGAARHFGMDVFGPPAAYVAEATIDGALKWNHDFVDPWSPGTGRTDQVVAIFLAALGVGAPAAGGLLVAPLVKPQD